MSNFYHTFTFSVQPSIISYVYYEKFCSSIGMFHSKHSLVFTKNLLLLLLSKISLFLDEVKYGFKNSKILEISNFGLPFLVLLQLLNYQWFCDVSRNKNFKTYLIPSLLLGGRDWQLNYPLFDLNMIFNYTSIFQVLCSQHQALKKPWDYFTLHCCSFFGTPL